MGKITSIVGLVLIVAAGVLASVSVSYEDQIKANKELCAKYVKSAKEALSKGDKKAAAKFAKKAFKVDPDNKALYALLQEINGASATPATKSEIPANSNTNAPEQATKKAAPAAEEEEEEDGLGC